MATVTQDRLARSAAASGSIDLHSIFWKVMTALGSLKIAVAMFALGTLMLLIGTLAQDEQTIVDVKRDYFNSWIAYVDFDIFVPQTMYPHADRVPFSFAMPGGATIGLVLLINLFAAKLTRFKMHARGKRFIAGLVITLIGFAMIGVVIMSAHMGDGLQGEPPFAYGWIWLGVKVASVLMTLLSIAWITLWSPKNKILYATAVTVCLASLVASLLLVFTNDALRIPDPGLRIVWQLAKSLGVGCVLLAGLILLFGNRGGNVLVHFGVGLLMVGQFVFGDAQREERISLAEGQKTTTAVEVDTVEFVVIDRSPDDSNRVIAFDQQMIARSLQSKKPLSADGLPFDIQIDAWWENSSIQQRRTTMPDDAPEAKMLGLIHKWVISQDDKVGGASERSNVASAYCTLLKKEDGTPIGSYAVSQWLSDDQIAMNPLFDTVEIASKKYDIGLQFRRNYKDYSITLKDIVLEEYTNSEIPKDYSSYITIRDKNGDVLQDGRVWMNSPMRFRGETFYQSSYISKNASPYGVEQTVLQVVTNAGWLIPYVSCVLVGLGLMVHFGDTFARFAMKYERGALASSALPQSSPELRTKTFGQRYGWLIYMLAVQTVVSTLAVYSTMPKKRDRDEIDYNAIGSIPVHYGGRVKPLASAGAEVLEILSNKTFALQKTGDSKSQGSGAGAKEDKERKVPAEEWLFAVMMNEPWVRSNPLIRIDAKEVTTALKLERVKTNRYSYNDIVDGIENAFPQIQQSIQKKQANQKLAFEEERLLETFNKMLILRSLLEAYRPIAPPSLTTGDPAKIQAEIQAMSPGVEQIRMANNPAILPSLKPDNTAPVEGRAKPPARWDTFGVAFFDAIPSISQKSQEPAVNAVLKFFEISGEFTENQKNGAKINRLVQEFRQESLQAFGEEKLNSKKTNFEAMYERANLFSLCQALYIVAGLFVLCSYIDSCGWLRRLGFWIVVSSIVMHTIGIVARIYISERPPVVSLYSASVFIGWGIVLLGLVAELFFPIGVSLIVSSIFGFLSLLVAYGLDIGDTMPTLRAVLDTQFWLSTHVTSVTLGYSATFFAGIFGIAIVIAHTMELIFRGTGREDRARTTHDTIPILYRICYAVVCIGLFFSFVGTVLGGLWGDDSWGRFWGWDPKENGALMIVLWNALLLHARWDKLVGSLGFANLAIFGNVITAWSMFGTNQLGIGLHAYGAFEGNVVRNLVLWCAVQMAFIGLGIVLFAVLPKRSERRLPT